MCIFTHIFVLLSSTRLALHPRKQVLTTISDDWSWKMWAVPRQVDQINPFRPAVFYRKQTQAFSPKLFGLESFCDLFFDTVDRN